MLCFSKKHTFQQVAVTLLHKKHINSEKEETNVTLSHKKHIDSQEEGPTDTSLPHKKHKKQIDSQKEEPTKYFLVIARQRTGSGFLTTLLNNHSSIRCGSEKLRGEGYGKAHKDNATVYADKIDESADIQAPCKQRQMQRQSQVIKCPTSVGFKIMYDLGIDRFGKDLHLGFAKKAYESFI